MIKNNASLRHLHLLDALGTVRTELWNGREHLVVPVVALQEAVIHAVNAPTAEYVSTSALAGSVDKWNGHPLVVGHPTKNGKQISAHDPTVLARHAFGFIRQALMHGSRLGMEAMVDPERLVALKQSQLLADLRAGKSIEVSIGALVTTNKKEGRFEGLSYEGEWIEIEPDHLAFLPDGIGACSLEMGCGAHRTAAKYLVTAEKLTAAPLPKPFVIASKKGAQMNVKTLKARVLAIFDTPEQAASEEAAELISYNAMRTLFDGAGDQWDAASGLIDDLIADEEENPTETPAQEDAEEEVEDARLDAVRMHCYAMISALQSVVDVTYKQQQPELPPMSDPRYMEMFKGLVGKAISAKNMKVIQGAHDASHDTHAHTVALGAQCNGMKLMAAKMTDCPTCDGTGQMKTDGKQQDCPTCDGEGQVRAASIATELKAACRCEESEMKREDRIAALLKHEHNPLKDQKALEANTDEGLRLLEVHCENAAKLKTAADALQEEKDVAEAKLKTAAEHVPTDEEWLAKAPPAFRAMHAEKQAADVKEKTSLVTRLFTASKMLTKEQLEAKSLESLRELAAFAKIEAPVDFSIKGVPVLRSAGNVEDYAPPNPYEAGVKALQGKSVN